jgi:hypothetical protein
MSIRLKKFRRYLLSGFIWPHGKFLPRPADMGTAAVNAMLVKVEPWKSKFGAVDAK